MTETTTSLPDWTEFDNDYVVNGIPHRFVVRSSPAVEFFVDQGAVRIGARFVTPAVRGPGPEVLLAEIHVDDVVVQNGRAIEIWTDAEHLYANFYQLACEIVSSVVDEGADPDAAL